MEPFRLRSIEALNTALHRKRLNRFYRTILLNLPRLCNVASGVGNRTKRFEQRNRPMNHRIPALVAVLAAVALAGCVSQPTQVSAPPGLSPVSEPLTWVRKDGQSGRANPALADQFAADRADCVRAPGDNAALREAEACMANRGYALVPASQAAARAAQYRRMAGY